MSARPVLIDMFCGAGGAAAGYAVAGFKVIGIDIVDQPRYPGRFIRGDVTELTAADILGLGATAVHASPPCQLYSPLAAYDRSKVEGKYPDLVAFTRELLSETRLPFTIENVVQAPLLDTVILCGAMYGLPLYRHRGFEVHGFELTAPWHPTHIAKCSRNGNLPRPGEYLTITGGKHSRAWQRAAADAMGVPWLAVPADANTDRIKLGIVELCEAIPPRFTEYVGAALLTAVSAGQGEAGAPRRAAHSPDF